MLYQKIEPSPPLRHLVESFWIQESPAPPDDQVPTRVIPTGTVELLFHYRERFVHAESEGMIPIPRSYLTGQRTRPVLPLATGDIGIVIASFYPWGAGQFVRGADEVVDGYVDLGELIPREAVDELEERLAHARGVRERICHVETFLIGLCAGRSVDSRMVRAARILAAHPGERSIQEISAELSLSRRHFARTFRTSIGLPPKTFSRIMRFQQALRLFRSGETSWAEIAAACGYADQPHLIREMREFSARTPSELSIFREDLDNTFNGKDVSSYFDTVYL